MKDLRIVIVSWNASGVLPRCLETLPEACGGLDWDCVIVDNASTDNTLEAIGDMVKSSPRIDVIKNQKNYGFAFACNQGAANHQSRYVLLLNPDTECPAGSLFSLVKMADSQPEVGIMGPKLVYPDGRYQPSAQRFPGLMDQSLILLKLHHIFPNALALQKYFMQDMVHDKAQEVDQVMGACFLVRAACWDGMKGLDERYFIWFEEVDACRQAKANGWAVRYEPSVHIMHHEAHAFSQVFTWRRQKYFNDSLRKYMRKWHGLLVWLAISALAPIALAISGVLTPLNFRPKTRKLVLEHASLSGKGIDLKALIIWLMGVSILEAVSYLTNGHALEQSALTILAGLGMLWFSFRSPALALSLSAAELMIGGFGYLFGIRGDFFVRGLSLRMVMMGGFFLGWGLNAIRDRVWRYWKFNELILVQVWAFVLGMVLLGLARGLQLHQPFVFQDMNAWLFLLYFVPVLDVAHRYPKQLMRYVSTVMFGALIWLSVKILAVFYVFTHDLSGVQEVYAWVRDTRVGEITPMGGSAYRVFFQSIVYQALALPVILAWTLSEDRTSYRKTSVIIFAVSVLCLAVLSLSLSRSIWIGIAVSLLTATVLALKRLNKKMRFAVILRRFGWGLLSLAGAVILVVMVWEVPIPRPIQGSVLDLFGSRVSVSDPAAASRWELLPAMLQGIKKEPVIGQGFGSVVSYQSHDPRAIAQSQGGVYTTYAMEWGWLGFLFKFGIFGLVIMAWLMVSIIWRLWQSGYAWWVRAGLVAATVGISVIHFFTPYLDHPLGFGWILGMEGLLAIKREEEQPSYVWRK